MQREALGALYLNRIGSRAMAFVWSAQRIAWRPPPKAEALLPVQAPVKRNCSLNAHNSS